MGGYFLAYTKRLNVLARSQAAFENVIFIGEGQLVLGVTSDVDLNFGNWPVIP